MKKMYIALAAIFFSISVSHANVRVTTVKNLLFKLRGDLLCSRESESSIYCEVENKESDIRFVEKSKDEYEFTFTDHNLSKDYELAELPKHRPYDLVDFLNVDLEQFILNNMYELFNTNIMESTVKYSSDNVFMYKRKFVMGYEASRASIEVYTVEFKFIEKNEYKINIKRNVVSQKEL